MIFDFLLAPFVYQFEESVGFGAALEVQSLSQGLLKEPLKPSYYKKADLMKTSIFIRF